MNNLIIQKVEENLIKLGIRPHDKILVGFSGGPDSVFLLYALNEISKKTGLKIGAVHINHCLRGQDALNDESFSQTFAKELGIPFFSQKIDIKAYAQKHKISEEDAGRKKRYEFFMKINKEQSFNYTATAHHQDDNIEQIIMNLIRGTGIKGLTGIPKKRGNIIRPLININKNEILDFLNFKKIDFCIDKTNFETDYLRNKIRNILIPQIEKEYNPSFKKSICRLKDIVASENDFMETHCKEIFDAISSKSEKKVIIDLNKFRLQHKALQRRIIRMAIQSANKTTLKIESEHIESIIKAAYSKEAKEIHLPNKILCEKYFDTMEIKVMNHNLRSKNKPSPIFFHEKIDKCPETNIIVRYDSNIQFEICSSIKNSDENNNNNYDLIELAQNKIKFPLILRSIQPGDRFTPKNFRGRKKIKKILSENKLSPIEKQKTLVLESENKILWITQIAINSFGAEPKKGEKTIVIKKILG